MGCPLVAAGQMVELADFGDFSGRYFVKTATHKVSGSGGYTTSLELSAPAPATAESAHDEVSEAARTARQPASQFAATDEMNREADQKARDGFEELLQRLPEILSAVEETLLCLPEIAAAEAGRATDMADRQGWKYLEKMFYRWFGGKANDDAVSNSDVLWVSIDWALQYERVKAQFTTLASPTYLSTPNARQELNKILLRDNKFSKAGRQYFDYTNTSWTHWKADYFQQIEIKELGNLPPDGLFAAMGSFQLRALAKGYVEPLLDSYIVVIQGISIIIWDSFNFDGEQPLGIWQCNPPKISYLPGLSEGIQLTNEIFRNFRKLYKNGADFLVLSQPKAVDPWPGFSYEA